MDVATYERETYEGSYYESKTNTTYVKPNCYGCYLLDRGEGGENQLAHMEPGGCLYQELSDDDDWTEKDFKYTKDIDNVSNKNNGESIPRTKTCINCTDILETNSHDLFCSVCHTKEDREREIRYQSFIADNYAIKN